MTTNGQRQLRDETRRLMRAVVARNEARARAGRPTTSLSHLDRDRAMAVLEALDSPRPVPSTSSWSDIQRAVDCEFDGDELTVAVPPEVLTNQASPPGWGGTQSCRHGFRVVHPKKRRPATTQMLRLSDGERAPGDRIHR